MCPYFLNRQYILKKKEEGDLSILKLIDVTYFVTCHIENVLFATELVNLYSETMLNDLFLYLETCFFVPNEYPRIHLWLVLIQ